MSSPILRSEGDLDNQDPGRKTGTAFVGRNRSMDLEEGLLCDVFGIGPVATASHRKAEDTIAIAPVEFLETPALTIGESLDERLIGIDESRLSRIFHDFAPDSDGSVGLDSPEVVMEARVSDLSPILVLRLSPDC